MVTSVQNETGDSFMIYDVQIMMIAITEMMNKTIILLMNKTITVLMNKMIPSICLLKILTGKATAPWEIGQFYP